MCFCQLSSETRQLSVLLRNVGRQLCQLTPELLYLRQKSTKVPFENGFKSEQQHLHTSSATPAR